MFCSKCGTQLPDGASFCGKCGANTDCSGPAKVTAADKPEDKLYNKAVSFVRNAPLLMSGLIVSLLSWPIYLWFGIKIRLPGNVRGVLEEYRNYREMRVWDKAVSSSETLEVFCGVGIVLLVLGIVLYILEAKGIIRKSGLRSICLFAIPVIVMIVISVCTYPAIFNYAFTFSYLIY